MFLCVLVPFCAIRHDYLAVPGLGLIRKLGVYLNAVNYYYIIPRVREHTVSRAVPSVAIFSSHVADWRGAI